MSYKNTENSTKDKKSKIGIITFHRAINLGAALQASALCKYINQIYGNCEIIDFIPNDNCGNAFFVKHPALRTVKNSCLQLFYILKKNRSYKFSLFRKKEMVLSPKTYYGDKDMKLASNRYDLLISGSDQILNVTLSGNSESYYLSFDDTAKKISYASSFGRTGITPKEKEMVFTHLSKFNALSVRETSAGEIINRLIGKDSTLVLDPVFLLTKKEWLSCMKPISKPHDKYIFVYSMEDSESLKVALHQLQSATKLPIILVNGGGFLKYSDVTIDANCGPIDFLDYINHAEYIVTNSFHGTAMALILGKNFITISHSSRNARLQNIMSLVHAEHNLVPYNTLNGDVMQHMNNGNVLYEQLEPYIISSKQYLSSSIEHSLNI